ncbi:MAG: hypothetical protein SF052_01010 [Bacteroidia bacterium]|nr:hypothetical protein [Bacteroidia bacterium]
MKSFFALIVFVMVSFSTLLAQRWIDDSLLWVKGPMNTFVVKHFESLQSSNPKQILQELTYSLSPSLIDDSVLLFKKIYQNIKVQDVRLAKSTPEGELVFVHISAAVERRLPYDRFRSSAKLRAWAKQKGLDIRHYIAFKIEGKSSPYKINSR